MSSAIALLSGSGDPVAPAGPARRGRIASFKRALAIMLLPASILPVPLLGPTLLRAPRRLWRQVSADVQRMEQHHSSTKGAHR